MALPDLIEMAPLDKSVRAEITVPGSKSITNRALILAALGEGEMKLEGALWSEDTQVVVDCLQELGFMVNVEPDPKEGCNRAINVYGKGGAVPPGGTERQPVELFVGNAGTAARFLAAFLCLGKGVYRLHGTPRMHERPQAGLFKALRELGYRIDSPNDKLPAVIHGSGPRPGKCLVNVEDSSQFASALVLSAGRGGWVIEITGENSEESPYVTLTWQLVREFGSKKNSFRIDADASSAGYFWGLDWLLAQPSWLGLPTAGSKVTVEVEPWFDEAWQIDAKLPRYLKSSPARLSRDHDLGDSIMIAIVLAPFRGGIFTDLGRLRLQECERVTALRTELARCGAEVVEHNDCLQVSKSMLHGAEIETYNDHRMAMCFAILGLKVPGIKIKNPACVKKTFPSFFQKLAAPPPRGVGACIRDGITGRALRLEELFAS